MHYYRGDFEKYVNYYPQMKIYSKNFRMGSTFWKVQKISFKILKKIGVLKGGIQVRKVDLGFLKGVSLEGGILSEPPWFSKKCDFLGKPLLILREFRSIGKYSSIFSENTRVPPSIFKNILGYPLVYFQKTPQTLRLSVWKYARSFLLWLHSQDGWVVINSCLFMMDGIYACVAWYIITHAFVIIMDIYAYWIQSLSVLLFSHHSSLSLFHYGYARYWWETFAAVTFRHIHSLSTHHNCRTIIV